MDKSFSVTPYQIGRRFLVPGVMYHVTERFEDHKGTVHELGESWKFEGWSFRKTYRGYSVPADLAIFASDENGAVRQFQMSWGETAQAPVLSNFERYVSGTFPSSVFVLEGLNQAAKEALRRVSSWIEPIPEGGEELIAKVLEASSNARIANDRAGWTGNPYEKTVEDMRCLENEILRVIAGSGN